MPKENVDAYEGIYPVNEINEARRCLVSAIYQTRSKSKTVLETKLKCGILTQDVIDYFVHENKDSIIEEEEGEIEEFEDDEIEALTKANDENLNSNIVEFSENKIESSTADRGIVQKREINNILQVKAESKALHETKIKNNLKLRLNFNTKRLSHLLNMNHICVKNCLKNKKISRIGIGIGYRLVFACDVCFTIFHDQEMALFHINDFDHISASEFLTDKHFFKNKVSLKYIVNRCSIKSSSKSLVGVFCPVCSFYFNDSILACGLHYQYHHNSHHPVYSLARFKRESSFKIGKTHSCIDCKTKFDRLHQLTSHLSKTKHFPESLSPNEINLYQCQFDICQYKSVHFHSFKQHIIKCHSFFFNGKWASRKNNETKVTVKVSTYEKPSSYLHFPRFSKALGDHTNEKNAIEDLLELYKGHTHDGAYSQMKSIITRIKARKRELEKEG
jgi:hypothetical protein